MTSRSPAFRNDRRPNVSLPVALAVLMAAGYATMEKKVQQTAKDWCMTIRGSQVIPAYPLTEEIHAGDVFLIQVPMDRQQEMYKQRGFLPLENLIARTNPDGYVKFYNHSFFSPNLTNNLPRDWFRPEGPGIYRGTNGTNTASWQSAPRAASPSYSFSVRNGAGLSLLNSDAANGTI